MKTNLLPIAFAVLLSTPLPRAAGQEEVEDVLKKSGVAPGEAADAANRIRTEIQAGQPRWAPGPNFAYQTPRLLRGERPGGRPVIIRSSEPDPKEQNQLEEDLTVMNHLLDQAVEGKAWKDRRESTALGIDLYFKPSLKQVSSLYLEDYGAVFMLNVPFPLLAPPTAETNEEKPPSSSAWEQARREVYGTPGSSQGEANRQDAYDQDRVDELKNALVEALKNATNIRGLKPEESVTINVTGGRGPAAWPKTVNKLSSSIGKGQGFGGSIGPAGRASTLTLRARKSDIDALARNKMTLEEFRKKIRWATYTSARGASAEEYGLGWSAPPPIEDIDVQIR